MKTIRSLVTSLLGSAALASAFYQAPAAAVDGTDCTATVLSFPEINLGQTATVFTSTATALKPVDCSGCAAVTTSQFPVGRLPVVRIIDTVTAAQPTTVTSFVCAQPGAPTAAADIGRPYLVHVPAGARPAAAPAPFRELNARAAEGDAGGQDDDMGFVSIETVDGDDLGPEDVGAQRGKASSSSAPRTSSRAVSRAPAKTTPADISGVDEWSVETAVPQPWNLAGSDSRSGSDADSKPDLQSIQAVPNRSTAAPTASTNSTSWTFPTRFAQMTKARPGFHSIVRTSAHATPTSHPASKSHPATKTQAKSTSKSNSNSKHGHHHTEASPQQGFWSAPPVETHTISPKGMVSATCTRSLTLAPALPKSTLTIYPSTVTHTSHWNCGGCAIVYSTLQITPLTPVAYVKTKKAHKPSVVTELVCTDKPRTQLPMTTPAPMGLDGTGEHIDIIDNTASLVELLEMGYIFR